MKRTLSLVLAVLFFVFPADAQEYKVSVRKPRHIIFLIHGIGGKKDHFGFTSKALSRVLNKKNPSVKYVIRNIEYDTGNNEKMPYDFAKDINIDIQRITASGKFKEEDKISLIMHSQGGLIGSIWMFQSMMSKEGYSTPETIKHLDAFITLGTPFWGAKTAQWGSEIKELTNSLGVNLPLSFGKNELEQMSFGSDMIYDFRMAMIDEKYKLMINHLRENVRFLNIVGVADILNPLGILVSGTAKYEDDGAVPLSSARFDFLYSQSLKSEYEQDDKVLMDNMKEVKMAPYVVVNAMHRSPLPETDNFAGIAQTPKACINNEECKHPAFLYLWKHILGREIKQLDDRLGDFKSFLIDVNVRVNAKQEYQCDDINIEFFKLDGSPLKDSNVEMTNFAFYAKGNNKSKKYQNHCRFYFTGQIKRVLEHRQEAILVKISGKDLKARFIELRLKQGYSSFVDVNLVKN